MDSQTDRQTHADNLIV